MATNPRSTTPSATAAITSGIDARGTRSADARSGWVKRACSVNVPGGPRKPTRGAPTAAVAGMTGWGTGWEDRAVDEASLRELVDAVAAGRLDPDDAVRRLRRLPFADLDRESVGEGKRG